MRQTSTIVLFFVLFFNVIGIAEPLAANAATQAKLAELTSELRIGTEYFLNPSDTKDSIDKQFRLMHATGITLVRVFIIWNDVERVPGEWDFHRYDWIYDAAAKNGIQIVATLCPEDPPGWKNETPFYYSRVNLNDPVARAEARIYFEKGSGPV